MTREELDEILEYMANNDFDLNEICFVEGLEIPDEESSSGRQFEQMKRVSQKFMIKLMIIKQISVLEFYKEIEEVIKDRSEQEVKILTCRKNVIMMDLLMIEKSLKGTGTKNSSMYVFHSNKISSICDDTHGSHKEKEEYWNKFFSEFDHSTPSVLFQMFQI